MLRSRSSTIAKCPDSIYGNLIKVCTLHLFQLGVTLISHTSYIPRLNWLIGKIHSFLYLYILLSDDEKRKHSLSLDCVKFLKAKNWSVHALRGMLHYHRSHWSRYYIEYTKLHSWFTSVYFWQIAIFQCHESIVHTKRATIKLMLPSLTAVKKTINCLVHLLDLSNWHWVQKLIHVSLIYMV